ncbi:hypothetical protein [Lujinxingia sediminis]|uniref:hypothetical protein n=1 Tax=Lujinxingia sediminis TaxID=2480984 RepID=UPI0013E38B97|nr:hypothetical protein [Lujinxingia sediminis]
MRKLTLACAAIATVYLTGCQESVVVASNGAAMFVASALLWSTVRLSKHTDSNKD